MDYKLEYTPATGYYHARTFVGWDRDGNERWDFLRDRYGKPKYYGHLWWMATNDIIAITEKERELEMENNFERVWED